MWPIHRRWPRSIGPYGGAASVHTAPVISLRQGSNELDSSCSRERSSPVMLSAAKHLAADRDRPFASLRVTGCDESNCQGLCFTIEPCLNTIIGVGGGFPVGRYIGGGLHTRVCLVNLYRAL